MPWRSGHHEFANAWKHASGGATGPLKGFRDEDLSNRGSVDVEFRARGSGFSTSMTTENDSVQTIRDYLLGRLPEKEAERLDELSVTDDDYAERIRAAEH